jgi:hypothetical protein
MATPTHGARSMKSKAFGFWAAAAFAVQGGACTGQLDIGRVADGGGAASPDGGSSGAGAPSSGSSSGSGGSSGFLSGSSGSGSFAGSSSGSGSGTSGGTSSGSPGSSSGSGPTDASFEFNGPFAPAGLAGFAFVVNGVVQTPRTCPAESWEYPPPVGPTGQPIPGASEGGIGDDTVCGNPPCPGLTVLLVNTSQFPVAYTAQALWSGWEPPGVPFGNMNEVSGVMDPGGSVDITSAYAGGLVAVLGSSHPFVDPDAGKYVADGTTVPWPAGVAGSGGATQMYVAEIEIEDSCVNPGVYWP